MNIKTTIKRWCYLFLESKFYIKSRNNIKRFFIGLIPSLFTIGISAFSLWMVLALFKIIEMNCITYLQCVMLYFILAEIDDRFKLYITKRGNRK